jgi:TRAP-type mannitol/chloroaromatic compound transport system permease small subunit
MQFGLANLSLPLNFPPTGCVRWPFNSLGGHALQALLRIAGGIDRISWFFGIVAAALVLVSCAISAGNAVMRYAFNMSSNAWLEIQWQMFAGIFLLGAAQVLKLNEHVRVDILYMGRSQRMKLWIDVFGLIFFLVPVTVLMIWMGGAFFLDSFEDMEGSASAGGLPVWPVKALLPFGFFLLLLQGIAELIKRCAGLQGDVRFQTAYEKPLQ